MEHRVADLEELTTAEEEKEAVQEAGEPIDTDLDPIRVYFQEMGRHPLLTQEEEVLLAKEMEAGKAAVASALLTTRLVQREVASLIRRIELGDADPADLLDYPELNAEQVTAKWSGQAPRPRSMSQSGKRYSAENVAA